MSSRSDSTVGIHARPACSSTGFSNRRWITTLSATERLSQSPVSDRTEQPTRRAEEVDPPASNWQRQPVIGAGDEPRHNILGLLPLAGDPTNSNQGLQDSPADPFFVTWPITIVLCLQTS